jgi:hypothetical protein
MKPSDISRIRLMNQSVATSEFKSPGEVANWMGALQAQDYSMSKWAIGVRLRGSTDRIIGDAINRGEILRTHVLRPTWHLVSPENIRWLLNLTAPVIKSSLTSRHIELELSEALINKCFKIFRQSLKQANHLTREELISVLARHKISVENQRAYHVFVRAELDGIICSGIVKGGKQTYALLDERVPLKKDLAKNEALKKLALIYFTSHGPATLQDFKWWSGLPAADARNAFEIVKPEMASEKTASELYLFPDVHNFPVNDNRTALLLPAFDEFLISYKDRSHSLALAHFKKAVSENGIFRPVIVLDGQIIGLWKRTIKKEKVIIETELFKPCNKTTWTKIEKGAEKFALFIEKKPEIKFIYAK